MTRNSRSALLVFIVLVAGCGEEEPPVCPAPVEARTLTITRFGFARAEEGGDPSVVPGFNLDGRVSDDSDSRGCFHADFSWPSHRSRDGVDNQLGPVTGGIDADWYPRGTGVNTSYRDAFASGELTMTVEVAPDLGDRCATVALVVDGARHDAAVEAFDEGWVEARFDGGWPLPVFGGTAPVDLPLARGARISLGFGTEATFGVLGARVDVDDAVTTWDTIFEHEVDAGLIRMVAEGNADLDPDRSGECQSISSAWTFDAERL